MLYLAFSSLYREAAEAISYGLRRTPPPQNEEQLSQ